MKNNIKKYTRRLVLISFSVHSMWTYGYVSPICHKVVKLKFYMVMYCHDPNSGVMTGGREREFILSETRSKP